MISRGFLLSFLLMCRFVVIADDPIKKDTFITEYIGEVDILERNEQNSNDSIMDLVHNTYCCWIDLMEQGPQN